MPPRIEVPEDLAHLLEKRDKPDRRAPKPAAEAKKRPTDASGKPIPERRKRPRRKS